MVRTLAGLKTGILTNTDADHLAGVRPVGDGGSLGKIADIPPP
jgi:hypothetical protein